MLFRSSPMAVAVAEEKARERDAQQHREAKAAAETAMRADARVVAKADDADETDEAVTVESIDEGTAAADAVGDAAAADTAHKSA